MKFLISSLDRISRLVSKSGSYKAQAGGSYSVEDYILNLQRDGRLLLRFLARRSDVIVPEMTTGGAEANDTCTGALFDEVATIQRDPKKIPELIQSVDVLSRRANPANVRSVRLTSAYLGMSVEGGEPPIDIKREAFKIKVKVSLLSCSAVVVFALAIGFLADADYGRRMLKQLESLRQKESTIRENLSALPPEDFEATSLETLLPPPLETGRQTPTQNTSKYKGPFCHPDKQQVLYRQPIGGKAIDLCHQADDIRLRISLLYLGLADWNCWNYRVFPVNWLWTTISRAGLYCGMPTEQEPDDIQSAWRSHETRVSASIAVMTGFALPMMLSFLGGCAYVLRQLGMKLATWTLEPHDGKIWLHVLLAALLGGLVGVIWTSDEPVALGGFTLSLAAIAFFVGFSVEAVFRLIQTLIEGVVSTIRAPDATAGPASPITTSQVRRIAQEAASGVSQPLSLLGVDQIASARAEATQAKTEAASANAALSDAQKTAADAQTEKQFAQQEAAAHKANLLGAQFDTTLGKVINGVGLASAILNTIGPALPPGLLPPVVKDAVDKADSVLKEVQGITSSNVDETTLGKLTDAAETLFGGTGGGSGLGSLLRTAAPLLGAAVPGVGALAGLATLVSVGFSLGSREFERWRARVLAAPVTSGLIEFGTVTPEDVQGAMEQSPLLKAAFGPVASAPGFAAQLSDAVLRDDAVDRLWRLYGPGAQPAVFHDRAEIEKGLAEFKHALLAARAAGDITPGVLKRVNDTLANANIPEMRPGVLTPDAVNKLIDTAQGASTDSGAATPARAALDALVMVAGIARQKGIDLPSILAELKA